MINNIIKSFDVLVISLSVFNYFDSTIKLFSELHLIKYLILPFFFCKKIINNCVLNTNISNKSYIRTFKIRCLLEINNFL